MYMSARIIYLQTQKTGGTHIARLLEKYDGGRTHSKHQPLRDWAPNADKLILSSVRNPWEWYVSLWAYGCAGKGGLRTSLTCSRLRQSLRSWKAAKETGGPVAAGGRAINSLFAPSHAAMFRRLLSDPDNVVNFQQWLKNVLGDPGKRLLPEGYHGAAMKEGVGYFTYRFLRLATEHHAFKDRGQNLSRYEDIMAFYQTHNILDAVIRNEALEDGVAQALTRCGIDVSPEILRNEGKSNMSKHKDYRYYYSEDGAELVQNRERLLVETFGYRFDA